MDDPEPGLFEWFPDPDPQPPSQRPQRGRKRETWVLTATAEVSILDPAAVDEAVAQAEASGLMIGWSADSEIEDPQPQKAGAEPAARALDQLAWLIWPDDGQEALVDADAFRILSVESGVVGKSADLGTATWSVTVKLKNVDRLRNLATRAHPDEATLIADSLALAWQRATDPFAPLRSIPGITWRPKTVDIEHLPARPSPPCR